MAERLDRGAENDGADREENEGVEREEPNEGRPKELPPPMERPPKDEPPEGAYDPPPPERDTEALRAQVEAGVRSATRVVASPRYRTTNWCENIKQTSLVVRRRLARLRGTFFQTVKYYAKFTTKARQIGRQRREGIRSRNCLPLGTAGRGDRAALVIISFFLIQAYSRKTAKAGRLRQRPGATAVVCCGNQGGLPVNQDCRTPAALGTGEPSVPAAETTG